MHLFLDADLLAKKVILISPDPVAVYNKLREWNLCITLTGLLHWEVLW